MDLAKARGKKAKCIECHKILGFKDYICVIDPYSCTETRDTPLRVNLCVKCFENRQEQMAKILRGEITVEETTTSKEIMREIEDEIAGLPEEQRPTSNKRRKKKRLEKRKRRDLISKQQEKATAKNKVN